MKKKLPIIIGAIVLAVLIFVGAFFLLNKNNKGKESKTTETVVPEIVLNDNSTPKFIDGSVIDTKVKNKNDVFKALNEVRDMYGFTSAEDSFEIISEESSLDVTYYKLQQVYKTSSYLSGTKVYGYQLVVAVTKDNKVSSVTGNYYPNLDVKTYGGLKEDVVKIKIKEKLGNDIEILNSNKYVYIQDEKALLAYVFETACSDGIYEIITDSTSGDIIEKNVISTSVNYSYTGKDVTGVERTINLDEDSEILETTYKFYDQERNITIVDASSVGGDMGSTVDPNWTNFLVLVAKFYTSQGPISAKMADGVLIYNSKGDATVENAIATMYNLSVVYDYYKNNLGRNSYDNRGSEIIANIGVSYNAWKYDEYFNASWLGSFDRFLFGSKDGVSLGAALDIVAHEYTHGVIDYTADLINQGESGALNESYADILGSLIEGENFQLGETIKEMRDMTDPNKYNNPKVKGGKYYFPLDEEYYNEEWRSKTMKRLEEIGSPIEVWTDWDNKGVHTNSGVPNHAAYLMYANGAFESKEEMAKVWYNSLFLLTSTSDFEDCALAVIQTAKTLGLSYDEIKIIENAFVETKMLDRNYSKLSGKVVDNETNKPLDGVLVTAISKDNIYINYETFTNEDGEYAFANIPAATYTISFEKGKYETLEKDMTLITDKDNKLDGSLKAISEAEYKKSEVVFVMDISASMSESDPEDARKQIMVNILSSMDDNSSVALVVFTAKGKVINNGLSDKNVDKKILITDVFNIANDSGHNDDSGTNGRSGLEEALKLFTNTPDTRRYIVFMTDGADNRDDGLSYEEIIQMAKDKDIRVLTIGLGSDKDLNPEQLEKIAEETNGKYYHATTSKDLHKFDKNIFEEIN